MTLTNTYSQFVDNHRLSLSGVFLLVCAWLCMCLGVAVFVDPADWFKALAVAFFTVTLVKPAVGIGAFLLIMPFLGGGRPDEMHTVRFIALLAITDLALCLNMLKRVVANRTPVELRLWHPIAFWFGIYWLVALMSLTSLPPKGLLYFFEWPDPLSAFGFLATNEIQYIYSWKAFSILSLSVLFAIGILNTRVEAKNLSINWLLCILASLVATLILGPMDFYDVLNLTEIRPSMAASYGDAYRHQRAMSVFGNPGWFAQFATMATPAVLALLALKAKPKVKIALIIAIMALTEFNLILTYSRGGWLSYPLTLIVVWFAIYVLNQKDGEITELRDKAKKAVGKIIISVPITIAISLSLIATLNWITSMPAKEGNELSESNKVNTPASSAYIARAKTITDTGARTAYWEIVKHSLPYYPVLGGGTDSYGYRYNQLYLFEGAPFQGQAPMPTMQGSAHNVYFQTVMGRGLVGVISLLIVSFSVLKWALQLTFMSPSASNQSSHQHNNKLIALACATSCAALLIYGNVGEIFYIPSNYILLSTFLATAIRQTSSQKTSIGLYRTWPFIALPLLVIAHYLWLISFKDAEQKLDAISPPLGCYAAESKNEGPTKIFHWCGRRFEAEVPVYGVADRPMGLLSLAAHVPDTEAPLSIKVTYQEREILRQNLPRGRDLDLWVPLGSVVNGQKTVTVEVELSEGFSPVISWGEAVTRDKRLLAVQWLPQKRVPEECYGTETAGDGTKFRWCPTEFSVSVPTKCSLKSCTAIMELAPEDFSGIPKDIDAVAYLGGEEVSTTKLPRGEITQWSINVPVNAVESEHVELKIYTDWGAVPSVTNPTAPHQDPRLLSVRLLDR